MDELVKARQIDSDLIDYNYIMHLDMDEYEEYIESLIELDKHD